MKLTKKFFIVLNLVFAINLLAIAKGDQEQKITLKNLNIPVNATRIFDIQGKSHISPFKNQMVKNVYGVVTSIVYSRSNPIGFYLQDPQGDNNDLTSDGIFVYCKGQLPHNLEKGNFIRLSGTVEEFAYQKKVKNQLLPTKDLSLTQIVLENQESLQILNKEILLPTPIEISFKNLDKPIFLKNLNLLSPKDELIDFYESLEGMRVKLINPKVSSPAYRGVNYLFPRDTPKKYLSTSGGVVYNSYNTNSVIRLYLTRCNPSTPAVLKENPLKMGDSFDGEIVGILSYSHSNYQIELSEKVPSITRNKPQKESNKIEFKDDCLNIASYNLYNFSFNDKDRAKTFAEQFVNLLKAPDIICLMEVQDDDGKGKSEITSAELTLNLLVSEINKIDNTLNYKFVNIDPEKNKDGGVPNANIRCCYLYRTDRIELVEGENSPKRLGENEKSFIRTRKSILAHFKFKEHINEGKDFFCINNHFSSKLGDMQPFGCIQPAIRKSEKKRHIQAKIIADYINYLKEKHGSPVIISVGDYNDFWFSNTLSIFKDIEMINAIEHLPPNDRYTYMYNGYLQTLDNALVLNAKINKIKILNINSKSPNNRASDHDPIFLQLKF